MRYLTIGSGTAVPQIDRSAPCHLVRAMGRSIVIDLGPGSCWGLLRWGDASPSDVDLILFTHIHIDHCSDLAPFLFALRSREISRTKPLTIIGPPGTKEYYRNTRQIWHHRVDPSGYELNIEDWEGSLISWEGFALNAAPTSHSVPNLAWRIDTGNNSDCGIVLTGDGRATRELLHMGLSGNHVMVAESAAGPGEDLEGHMNPGQAGQLAAACQSSKLVLSHINPGHSAESILKEACAYFGGEVLIAVDGMEMEIG